MFCKTMQTSLVCVRGVRMLLNILTSLLHFFCDYVIKKLLFKIRKINCLLKTRFRVTQFHCGLKLNSNTFLYQYSFG